MRLIALCALVFGMTAPLGAQTPQPPTTVTQTDVAARKSAPVVVIPRKERPFLMEALIQKDQRLRTLIKVLELKEPLNK